MNNICYFVPKYLKETFEKSQIWPGYEEFIGYGPIGPIFWPQIRYFVPKYLKWISEKSHMELDPSDMVLVQVIYELRPDISNVLLLNI